jgi:hypothetical protein
MKKRINWLLIGVFLVASLLLAYVSHAQEAKISVLNPLGSTPLIRRVPMAPRLDTLSGKTIYIVNVKFPLTDPFFVEMQKALAERYPQVHWVLRDKKGTYFDDDPALWAEIKEKGNGVIMAIGH